MARPQAECKSLVIGRVRARQNLLFERQNHLRPHDRQYDALYEKIYFHELDGRDKVAQRLQLPLVAFLAISGFVGTMLQNVYRVDSSSAAIAFWVALGFAILALIAASGFFIVSLIGKKYSYLPVPNDWLKHQDSCVALYRDFDDAEKLTSAALTKNLIETYTYCGTVNGAINARKAFYVFMLLRCLVAAALCTLLAFSVFFVAKLDKNLSRTTHRVEIINPLSIREPQMTKQKPPPPPPPPPAREIREDRPTPTPAPPHPKPGMNHG